MKLLNDENVHTAFKIQSKISWQAGDIKIEDKKDITINSDSYTKGTKIYINDKWAHTKPIIINEIDKDLIVYNHIKDLIVNVEDKYYKINVINH